MQRQGRHASRQRSPSPPDLDLKNGRLARPVHWRNSSGCAGADSAQATVLSHLSRALALTPPYKSTPRIDADFQSNPPTNNVRSASAMAWLKVSKQRKSFSVHSELIEGAFQALLLASAAASSASGDAYYGHSRRRAAWPYSFGGFSKVISDGLGDGRDFYADSEEAWEHPARPRAREAQFGGGYAEPVSTSHSSFTIGGTSLTSAIDHGAGTSFGSSSSSFGSFGEGLPRLAGGGFAAEDSYGAPEPAYSAAPEPAYSAGNSYGGGFSGGGFGFGSAFSPSDSLPTYGPVPDLFENLPDPFEPVPPGMESTRP